MDLFVLAILGAGVLFLIRQTIYRAYRAGSTPRAVPAVAFGLVWGALPLLGVLAGRWPANALTIVLSVSAFALVTTLMWTYLPPPSAR
jgi:hypothetical protein